MTEKITIEELQTKSGKRLGILTLNDPRTINALSVEMIRTLYPQLISWQADDNIVAVFLHSSSERGLCSGGNIRHLYDSMVAENEPKSVATPNPMALEFFCEEYQLDHLIHAYEKPIIVWGHGIVMGGGVGLMVGASHRIVTLESHLAMPEIGIGLFPDVGGSWFLNRMPMGCGLFVGLTGAPLHTADALFVGLADYAIANESKELLLQSLTNSAWQSEYSANHTMVSNLLNEMDISASLPAGNLQLHAFQIDQLTPDHNFLQIAAALIESKSNSTCDAAREWWNNAIESLTKGCPTTAHLVYQQLQRAEGKSLTEVFQMELNMAMQCVAHPDFQEGVRALLVDKDKNPIWQHASIADVPAAWINEHFQPLISTNN